MLKLRQSRDGLDSDINKYIGVQLRRQRIALDLSLQSLATCLDLKVEEILLIEDGKMRLFLSDFFLLKRTFDIPLTYFFSHEGECFKDVVLDRTEMADVFLYFSNINDPQARKHLLKQIKLASSVF